MIRIKCASGFGDAIYPYPIIQHYIKQGEKDISLMTDFKEIYTGVPVKIVPHSKDWASHKISYCRRKYTPGTSQFQDVCLFANVPSDLPLRVNWKPTTSNTIESVKAKLSKSGKKLCIFSGPFRPFGRADEFGKEMTIDFKALQKLITHIHKTHYIVIICSDAPIYNYDDIDLDINGETSVSDVLTLVQMADRTIGQVGHILPISEALGTPGLIFFSKKGLQSPERFISAITPEKVIHYKDLVKHIIDDWDMNTIIQRWEDLANAKNPHR